MAGGGLAAFGCKDDKADLARIRPPRLKRLSADIRAVGDIATAARCDASRRDAVKRLYPLAGLLLAFSTAASADPWKDESGNGRDRYYDRRGDDRGDRDLYRDRDRRYGYRIPRGQLPPPGECRIWLPNRPAGQQPPPTSCREARYLADRYGGRVIRSSRRY